MNRPSGAFLVALALFTVIAPLATWLWAPPDTLIGICGVARGEFENWAWMDWWMPRHVAEQAVLHGGTGLAWLRAVLCAPRDLDCGNYLDGWLITQPLKGLLDAVRGHDARVIAVLGLNGLAAFFAGREAADTACSDSTDAAWPLRRDAAALVGAVLVACNPITLWDVAESRFAQALIAPAVAYVGCLLRWMRTPTPAAASWSGLMLALTGITYWFMAIFLAPLALLSVGCTPRGWRSWLLHLMVATVIAAPFAWPFLASSSPHPAYGTPFPPYDTLAIPAPGILGPPGPGLVVAQSVDLASPLQPPLGPSLPWPWIVYATLALGAWKRRARPAALLAGCAVVWWALSLGPVVRLHGERIADGPIYAGAYRWVPFVWRLSWPARTLPLVALAGGLLCVPALASLLHRLTNRLDGARQQRAVWVVSAGLAGLLLAGARASEIFPLPVTRLSVPAPYRDGGMGDPRDGVVELSLPLNSASAAWYQSWHGHPLLGGQGFSPSDIDRLPPWARDPQILAHDGIFEWAAAQQAGESAQPFPHPAHELSLYAKAGFPWLVVQRSYGGVPIRGAASLVDGLSRALGPPVIDVPEMCAWRLDRAP